jgi:dihydrofolate reductase
MRGVLAVGKIRYGVAMSLDGFIAGPKGEADWIAMDPEVNFAEIWAQFDTLLMGRRTYEAAVARLGKASMKGMRVVVVSRTLRGEDHLDVTVISELDPTRLQSLRTQSSKDIWLMGGGELFRSLLDIEQVDTVEVSVVPVLLSTGVPLLPPSPRRTTLKLSKHKVYRSGLIALTYEVQH